MKLPVQVAPVNRGAGTAKVSQEGVKASNCNQWCYECKVLGYPMACQIAHYACNC